MSKILPAKMLKTFLLDGSDKNMNVDGSVTPAVYSYTVPAFKSVVIHRMMIYFDDSTNFVPENFGNVSGPLSNGVLIKAHETELFTWFDNIDVTCTMFDTEGRENFGKAAASLSGRWTFDNDTSGRGLFLDAGQSFSLTIRDDLSGLTAFRATVSGVISDG